MSKKLMTKEAVQLLYVEDDMIDQKALIRFVRDCELPYGLTIVSSLEEARSALLLKNIDLVLLDYTLSDGEGIELLDAAGEIPVIFVTGGGNEEMAVRAMRNGARDYLIKDVGRNYLTTLPVAIENVLSQVSTEKALRESEEKNRKIIDTTGEGFWMFDESYKTVEVNRALLNMLGKSRMEVIGKTLFEIIETDNETLKDDLAHIYSSPQSAFEATLKNVKKEEARVIFHTTTITDENGAIVNAFAFVSDITERMKNERRLAEAKRVAEEATSLKDKFVSLVAHDLKSPFTNIIGLLRVLKLDKGSALSAKGKGIVDLAIKSGEGMIVMIDELLNISRLQTGVITPDPRFFDGSVMVAKAIEAHRHLADEKGIRIDNRIRKEMRLFADYDLFSQVIHNLINNAVKFCNPGGFITIFSPEGEPSTIAVKDSGTGIEEERAPLLFRSEEKTSTIGTAGETGTGLGLPLSSDIMKAHNGKIDIESPPGCGATFFARLPNIFPTVLIVDDDKNQRELLSHHMRSMGALAIEAKSGSEALKAMEKRHIHLALVDLVMPVMSGFELIEEMKKNEEFSSIPLIAMTSSSGLEPRQEALRVGADDFISKPFSYEELIPRAKKHLV